MHVIHSMMIQTPTYLYGLIKKCLRARVGFVMRQSSPTHPTHLPLSHPLRVRSCRRSSATRPLSIFVSEGTAPATTAKQQRRRPRRQASPPPTPRPTPRPRCKAQNPVASMHRAGPPSVRSKLRPARAREEQGETGRR